MRRAWLLTLSFLAACGGPAPLIPDPSATVPAATVKVSPPPGPFNGAVELTFTADREATVFVSLDGKDPRTTSAGRLSGPSPFKVTLNKTAVVKYFASEGGKDGDLLDGQWIRAGGPAGTISGTVVVGSFATAMDVGLSMNGKIQALGHPLAPVELPFSYDHLASGTYRLFGLADRNGDGQLIPFLDYQGDTVTVTLDLTDPFKASAEGLKLYLGASGSGLGTLKGTVTLPRPPAFQNLQVSVLSPDAFGAGVDPQALLTQLQNGYRLLTNQTDTKYPYVITDLQPGRYMPVASLIGFGSGGMAANFVANPLRTVTITANHESQADFAFGPITLNGTVTIKAASAPTGFGYGVIAARATSIADGIQAVLMPVLLSPDPASPGDVMGSFAGQSLRANSTITLRAFTNANGANPLTDALTWVINPFGTTPGHATVQTTTADVTKDFTVP